MPTTAPPDEHPAPKKSGLTCGNIGCAGVVALFVATFFGALFWAGGSDDREPAAPTASMAYTMCQEFVERRLKAPATAEYPRNYTEHTEQLDARTFRVRAHVDAQNSFGAQIRTPFECTVRHTGERDWELLSLALDGE